MLELIVMGMPLMIPLLIESVLAVAVTIDRYIAFRANSKVDVRTLRAKMLAMLEAGQGQEALALCFNTPGPVSAVLAAGQAC